ncbi:AMP-binding protein [Anaerobiospirillum sp. NML120448]|uniref:AMP-binding protein n=1 Tax=Anaerobiospirillum sp. NML120448 TaxID=2932816 RepID=UPI001FF39568|nr:AMP-binding protein [Anaerobiospirillum sp. NML120448]MCK0515447.1 AMP-binding protein [Anaerobiospirillum sp. NML120448]
MNYITNIPDQVLYLKDKSFSASDIKDSFASYVQEHYGTESFEYSLAMFLKEWFNDSPLIQVKTSGSTGKPKVMMVEKTKMINSACMTLSFLGLKHPDSALLCMPLEYIAGKMLVVRALVGSLKLILVPPCSNPIAAISDSEVLNFAAMIPMQVSSALKDSSHEQRLKAIEHLIIGGGAVDDALASKLKSFPHNVYSTYGMTETLSHIALRRLSGPQASSFYSVFTGVKVYPSAEQTLTIEAPLVNNETLITNDIVEFNDQGQFRVLGRKDNVINSGGVKLQIEELEQWLKDRQSDLDDSYSRLKNCSLLISSRPDPKFGSIVVMLYATLDNQELSPNELEVLFDKMPKYWHPKAIVKVEAIPLTGTNKPDRAQAKILAQ